MNTHELKTAAYLIDDSLQPVQKEEPEVTGASEQVAGAGGFIAFVSAFMVFFGYLGGLLACSDLFEIPIYNDQYKPSPLSPLASTTPQLWILYTICVSVFVLGAIGVGSQPWYQAVGVVYVMCPVAGLACIPGWPLRNPSRLRESLAVIYAGLGLALAVGGVMGIQSRMEKSNTDQIIIFSFVFQAGLAMLGGGALTWFKADSQSRAEG